MTTTTTPPKFRYIGITDECIVCEKCGKPGLKSTVILAILDADGNEEDVTYYGSSCAAQVLGIRGGGRAVLNSARVAHDQTIEAAKHALKRIEFYGLPLEGEPTEDVMRAAKRLYIQSNYGVADLVQRTGKKVPVLVMEMLDGFRRDIALAELLRHR